MFYAYRSKLPSQQRVKRPSHLCIFAAGKLSKEIALSLACWHLPSQKWMPLNGLRSVHDALLSQPFPLPCNLDASVLEFEPW